jgi:iron complex transport system permease protein
MNDPGGGRLKAKTRLSPWLLPSAVLIAVILIAFSIGPTPISPLDFVRVLFSKITGVDLDIAKTTQIAVWDIRVPRVLAAIAIGAGLASAGATYQGLFRNPLVAPDILGVSAGASFGAVAGLYWGLPVVTVQILSFTGGLVAVGLVYGIASLIRQQDPILLLVLSGVAVGSLFGAAVSLIKILADPYNLLPSITFWLLGSINSVKRSDFYAALPAFILGLAPMIVLRWRMNVMSLGEEEAKALGVNPGRLRLILIAAATLMTSAAVSIAGVIGWVGLIVPHIARQLAGPEFSKLLPASLLLGAGFLVFSDFLARTVSCQFVIEPGTTFIVKTTNCTVGEIPLGILTSLAGAPFFLWLLAFRQRGGW